MNPYFQQMTAAFVLPQAMLAETTARTMSTLVRGMADMWTANPAIRSDAVAATADEGARMTASVLDTAADTVDRASDRVETAGHVSSDAALDGTDHVRTDMVGTLAVPKPGVLPA
ncbi:MAG: hypothetical protein WBA25_05670 [Jannaschia sp.]